MRTPELLMLYALIGAGSAAVQVLFARGSGGARRSVIALDALLLLAFWPLYGPYVLLRAQEASTSPSPAHALAIADPAALGALFEQVARANERLSEIDRLLLRPEFSEDQARSREKDLEECGEARAARTARGRVEEILRLKRLRDHFSRELVEVDELLATLKVQIEIVRVAGAPEEASRDLLVELASRVEGLDAVLEEESRLQPRAEVHGVGSTPTSLS